MRCFRLCTALNIEVVGFIACRLNDCQFVPLLHQPHIRNRSLSSIVMCNGHNVLMALLCIGYIMTV